MRHNFGLTLGSYTVKHINISPSVSYNEIWYFKRLDYSYNETARAVDIDTTAAACGRRVGSRLGEADLPEPLIHSRRLRHRSSMPSEPRGLALPVDDAPIAGCAVFLARRLTSTQCVIKYAVRKPTGQHSQAATPTTQEHLP